MSIGKNCLFLSLLATTTLVYAKIGDDQIPCPSLETIQQAANKIDKAESKGGVFAYTAYTSSPAFYESNLPWIIGVPYIKAKSPEKAIKLGKKKVAIVKTKQNEYVLKDKYGYVCLYQPNNVVALGGATSKAVKSFNP